MRGRKCLCRKVWTKILSPNIPFFVAILKFVAIYALFGRSLAKKCFFGSKTEMHYYMAYIAYNIEFNLQICNYVPKQRICRENSKHAHDKKFCGQFCLGRKAVNFCHPDPNTKIRIGLFWLILILFEGNCG